MESVFRRGASFSGRWDQNWPQGHPQPADLCWHLLVTCVTAGWRRSTSNCKKQTCKQELMLVDVLRWISIECHQKVPRFLVRLCFAIYIYLFFYRFFVFLISTFVVFIINLIKDINCEKFRREMLLSKQCSYYMIKFIFDRYSIKVFGYNPLTTKAFDLWPFFYTQRHHQQ